MVLFGKIVMSGRICSWGPGQISCNPSLGAQTNNSYLQSADIYFVDLIHQAF